MRILLCCHLPLSLEMGASKVYIEAARAYRENGVNTTIIGIDEIVGESNRTNCLDENWRLDNYSQILRDYLINNKETFDIVEYEHLYMPDRPKELKEKILVARSVLLEHHFEVYKYPRNITLRSIASRLFKGDVKKKYNDLRIKYSNITFANSDYVNVPNDYDKKILIESGLSENKIIVQPYGVHKNRRELLEKCTNEYSLTKPTYLFVGSFDYRKGCLDLIYIFKKLHKDNPNSKLRLLGAKGLFQTEEQILDLFPRELHGSIEVVLRFKQEEILNYMNDITVGIFPSYIESFGFGVLEQTAARIPVFAYDIPGPAQLLPDTCLSKFSDKDSIVMKIIKCLSNESEYKLAKNSCYNMSLKFDWENTVKETIKVYESSI